MSDIYDQVSTTYPVPESGSAETTTSSSSVGEKADTAKEQAGQLKNQVAESGGQVAGAAKDEAGKVVSEAKYQAKDLFDQTQAELKDQAAAQQKRVASGLRSVSDELESMAGSSESGGVAADLVQQAATRAGSIASWLEDRDPGSVLREVRSYASRKPGTFIAVAAIAGLVAGRLTKSLVSNASDAKAPDAYAASANAETTASTSTPSAPTYVNPVYVPPTTTAATGGPSTGVYTPSASFDEPAAPGSEGTESYFGDRA